MAISPAERDFVAYVVESMQILGAVYSKRMFGGHGVYLDGLMFALIADNNLYFKVDAQTKPAFETRGLAAFTFMRKGKEIKMSYYQSPEDVLDNEESMSHWANMAHAVAVRAANKKRSKPRQK